MNSNAEVVSSLSNLQFATNAQLQSDFDLNGKTEAHILFGNRPCDEKYCKTKWDTIDLTAPAGNVDWYIAGKDGNGYIVLYSSDVLVGSNFCNSYISGNPDALYGCGPASGHYDSRFNSTADKNNYYQTSDIKNTLDSISKDDNYFKNSERNLMSTTTLNTLMRTTSSVAQKLYLAGGTYNDDKIFVGSSDNLVIPISKLGSTHRLRTDSSAYDNTCSMNVSIIYKRVVYYFVDHATPAVACALKINLSSVNFASSATSTNSTAQSTTSGTFSTISGAPAMRLRTNGLSNAPTVSGSTVTFNATSSQRLMVQVNDGTNNYQTYFNGNGSSQTVDLNKIGKNSNISAGKAVVGKCWIEQDEADTNGRIMKSTAAQTIDFTRKDDPTCNSPTNCVAIYGQILNDVSIENPSGNTAGTWSWTDSSTSVGDVGEHTFSATFTPSDTSTYNTKTGINVSVTVNKANPTCSPPIGLTATYGQTLNDITIENPTGNTSGTWAWTDTTASVGDVGERIFLAMFTPTDTTNYNAISNIPITVTVCVGEISVSMVTDPGRKLLELTGDTVYDDSCTISTSRDGVETVKFVSSEYPGGIVTHALEAVSGNFVQNQKFTSIDYSNSTPQYYYYIVESDNLTQIPLTSFKRMEDRTTAWAESNSGVHSDKLQFIIDFSDTDQSVPKSTQNLKLSYKQNNTKVVSGGVTINFGDSSFYGEISKSGQDIVIKVRGSDGENAYAVAKITDLDGNQLSFNNKQSLSSNLGTFEIVRGGFAILKLGELSETLTTYTLSNLSVTGLPNMSYKI